MTNGLERHAYLAGPDVFMPDALAIGARKKAHLAALGIEGHFPFDNELPPSLLADPRQAATAIAQANERMMLDCCTMGRMGIILANMTPFHGVSMDVGTAFEVGFMSALAATRQNVLIVGYTDDPRLFEERVIADLYGGRTAIVEKNGFLYAPDGMMIEAYGGAENLMLTHAIEKTGGRITASFEEAAALADALTRG